MNGGERKERDYQSANLALNGQRAIGHDATNERGERGIWIEHSHFLSPQIPQTYHHIIARK